MENKNIKMKEMKKFNKIFKTLENYVKILGLIAKNITEYFWSYYSPKSNLIFMIPAIFGFGRYFDRTLFNWCLCINYIVRFLGLIFRKQDKFNDLSIDQRITFHHLRNFLLKHEISLYFMYKYTRFSIVLKLLHRTEIPLAPGFLLLFCKESISLTSLPEYKLYCDYIHGELRNDVNLEIEPRKRATVNVPVIYLKNLELEENQPQDYLNLIFSYLNSPDCYFKYTRKADDYIELWFAAYAEICFDDFFRKWF